MGIKFQSSGENTHTMVLTGGSLDGPMEQLRILGHLLVRVLFFSLRESHHCGVC